jgi:hypothetical protein
VLTPLVDEMRAQSKALDFNRANWGMADFDLPEQGMGNTNEIRADQLAPLALQAETRGVSAIQPAYDFDRLTLAHERRIAHERSLASKLGVAIPGIEELTENLSLTLHPEATKAVLYIPDVNGHYLEKRSLVNRAPLVKTTTVRFRLEKFAHQFPLRFDPCQATGVVSISSITALDLVNNRVVWELKGGNASKLVISGTAVWESSARSRINGWKRLILTSSKSNGRPPTRVISTGLDPQLILPKLPRDVGFPLEISIKMKFIPSQFLDLLK